MQWCRYFITLNQGGEMRTKKGFTLAELLIVLGIIGITAAVLLPAINNLMPDKTKIMYLKAKDELSIAIKSLSANSSLYPAVMLEEGQDILINSHPFFNNSKPIQTPFNKDEYSGNNKLCNLLAFSMNADAKNSCSQTNYPDRSSFTTSNGMRWWVIQKEYSINIADKKATYQTDIYVDVDPSKKSSNCMFGEPACNGKTPDTFKFLLAADGSLIPADPAGLHYINTRKQWLKNRYKLEGEILSDLEPNKKNFDWTNAVAGENKTKEPGKTEDKTSDSTDTTPDTAPQAKYDKVACGETYRGFFVNCYDHEYKNKIIGSGNQYLYTLRIYFYAPVASTYTYTTNVHYYSEDGLTLKEYSTPVIAKCVVKPDESECNIPYSGGYSYYEWDTYAESKLGPKNGTGVIWTAIEAGTNCDGKQIYQSVPRVMWGFKAGLPSEINDMIDGGYCRD